MLNPKLRMDAGFWLIEFCIAAGLVMKSWGSMAYITAKKAM